MRIRDSQRAREFAYAGKLVESNREILKLAQQNSFLTKMDVFQREAFAAATGKSVSELTAMVQADRERQKIMYGTDEKAKEMVREYERLSKLNQKNSEDTGKVYLLSIQQKSNQERLVAVSYTHLTLPTIYSV